MRMSRKLAGLLSAGLMTAGVTVFALPASASSSYWELMTFPEGTTGPTLCLEGDPDPTGPHATKVTQQLCSGSASQQWLPVSQGGDVYKFVNEASGLCLDTYGLPRRFQQAAVGQADQDRIQRTRFQVHFGDQVVAVAPPGRVGRQRP